MSIAIVDCGSGNLRSVSNAFRRVLAETGSNKTAAVTSDPKAVREADRIVLPGVGAFATCKQGILDRKGLAAALEERVVGNRAPFLGICVGMQLLAEVGRENLTVKGFGWLGGDVERIPDAAGLRIPHMGWNDFVSVRPHPLFEGIRPGDHAYFVHSYAYKPRNPEHVAATVHYGAPITAAVVNGNIAGTQFHPEKSQAVGLRLLANFLEWCP